MKRKFIFILFMCLLVFSCGKDYMNENDDSADKVDGDAEAGDSADEDPSDGDDEGDSADGDGDGESSDGDQEMEPVRLTVMTYNILCFFCNNEYDPWGDRLGYQRDIIERYDPDLIGSQELVGLKDLNEMLEFNPEYEALYFNEGGGPIWDEYPDAAIFYKRAMFEVVENGFYWLGDDPDTPWSGFEADERKATALWRLVAWAHFRLIADGREFYFADTHFDPNTPHQEWSAPIALDYAAPFAENMPVIMVGDFNSKPDSNAYRILTEGVDGEGLSFTNAYDIAEQWFVESNQDPLPAYDPDSRIDHIFIAGQAEWRVPSWWVDLWVYGDDDLYPSDHFPIVAELEFH